VVEQPAVVHVVVSVEWPDCVDDAVDCAYTGTPLLIIAVVTPTATSAASMITNVVLINSVTSYSLL
jgi:hypothetical protein